MFKRNFFNKKIIMILFIDFLSGLFIVILFDIFYNKASFIKLMAFHLLGYLFLFFDKILEMRSETIQSLEKMDILETSEGKVIIMKSNELMFNMSNSEYYLDKVNIKLYAGQILKISPKDLTGKSNSVFEIHSEDGVKTFTGNEIIVF